MPVLEERYFAQPVFEDSVVRLTESSTASGDTTAITVPASVGAIIAAEALYCQAPESEMPSRIVLYGSTILKRIQEGGPIFFMMGSSGNHQHLPVNFPAFEDTKSLVASTGADDSMDLELDAIASSLIDRLGASNGLTKAANFIALSRLVNYVGVNERVGRHLSFSL